MLKIGIQYLSVDSIQTSVQLYLESQSQLIQTFPQQLNFKILKDK